MTKNTISRVTIYKSREYIENLYAININDYVKVYHAANKEHRISLYFQKQKLFTPNWFDLFKHLNLDLSELNNKSPHVMSSGFILFINLDNTTSYICTGGSGHFKLLKNVEIEPRFGIEIAKKILSIKELKGLIQKDASGIINTLDRIFRGPYNPNGDIDNLHRVLTNIRATISRTSSNYNEIGSTIKAGDSLSVTGKKTFEELIEFVKKVDHIWRTSTPDLLNIPELEYLNPKHEQKLISKLWEQLALDLIEYYESNKEVYDLRLFLDNTDIGFLPDLTEKYEIIFERNRRECTNFYDVFENIGGILHKIPKTKYLETLNKITLKAFLHDADIVAQDNINHFICGDVIYNDEVYFVNNEYWYRANASFITKVNKELDELNCLNPDEIGLLNWEYIDEDAFNKAHNQMINLDKHFVRVEGETGPIEFCDLLKINENNDIDLIHVKHASGAALRALFAQGFVSAQLYADDEEFRKKIHNANLDREQEIKNEHKKILKGMQNRLKHNMRIVFAIYDEKHKIKSDANLKASEIFNGTITLFAKVDLLSRVQALRSIGYNIALVRIKPYIN